MSESRKDSKHGYFSFLHPREGEERGIKVIGGKQGVQKGIMDTVKFEYFINTKYFLVIA